MRSLSGIFIISAILALQAPVALGDCRQVKPSLRVLELPGKDPDLRSEAGICLVRNYLHRPDVARTALRIIRDPLEDILLREDLIEAFADSPLRKKIRIEGTNSPVLGQQDRDAIDRTLAGANNLMAVAQAMNSMEHTAPTTSYEGDFFTVLNEIALDETNHVLLRACALKALEKLSVRVVSSGIYDEKVLRATRDTLRTVAARDDDASYSLDAGSAYTRLAGAGLPGFTRDVPAVTRVISSVKVPAFEADPK